MTVLSILKMGQLTQPSFVHPTHVGLSVVSYGIHSALCPRDPVAVTVQEGSVRREDDGWREDDGKSRVEQDRRQVEAVQG